MRHVTSPIQYVCGNVITKKCIGVSHAQVDYVCDSNVFLCIILISVGLQERPEWNPLPQGACAAPSTFPLARRSPGSLNPQSLGTSSSYPLPDRYYFRHPNRSSDTEEVNQTVSDTSSCTSYARSLQHSYSAKAIYFKVSMCSGAL